MSYLIPLVDAKIEIFRRETKFEPNTIVMARIDGIAFKQELALLKSGGRKNVYVITEVYDGKYRGCEVLTSSDLNPGVVWVGLLDQANVNGG